MPSITTFNTSRARSYMVRLPLFTRLVLLAILGFWLVGLQSVWDVRQWGALIPKEMGLATCMNSFLNFSIFPFFPLPIHPLLPFPFPSCPPPPLPLFWDFKMLILFGLLLGQNHSVPHEYLSVYPSERLPRGNELTGHCAFVGAVRGRVRDFDLFGSIFWSWVNIRIIGKMAKRRRRRKKDANISGCFFLALTTIPSILYVLVEKGLGANTAVMGAR